MQKTHRGAVDRLHDGIIYLFQYGYISEAKHFRMMDALSENLDNQDGDATHQGRKF